MVYLSITAKQELQISYSFELLPIMVISLVSSEETLESGFSVAICGYISKQQRRRRSVLVSSENGLQTRAICQEIMANKHRLRQIVPADLHSRSYIGDVSLTVHVSEKMLFKNFWNLSGFVMILQVGLEYTEVILESDAIWAKKEVE